MGVRHGQSDPVRFQLSSDDVNAIIPEPHLNPEHVPSWDLSGESAWERTVSFPTSAAGTMNL
jgi:hypothetical protein